MAMSRSSSSSLRSEGVAARSRRALQRPQVGWLESRERGSRLTPPQREHRKCRMDIVELISKSHRSDRAFRHRSSASGPRFREHRLQSVKTGRRHSPAAGTAAPERAASGLKPAQLRKETGLGAGCLERMTRDGEPTMCINEGLHLGPSASWGRSCPEPTHELRESERRPYDGETRLVN